MFVDRAEITVKAGNGGNGCCSFRREAFVPKGGPNGGDGGDGGDVVFVASTGELTLSDFVFNRHFSAENGGDGRSKDMHGRRGQNLIIKVPLGTIIRNKETGDILADIDEAGAEVVIAKGGRGGRGNARFATPSNRAPREHEPGEKTEPVEVELELKMLADIGLVGFPNAGKSTLITQLSNARPKIANYPFTTLKPNLGMVAYREFQSFVIADIPGIIEGASEGKGLGLRFLRHIERNAALLFMIPAADEDGQVKTVTQIKKELKILQNELKQFNPELLDKSYMLAITKCDLISEKEALALEQKMSKTVPTLSISAVTNWRLTELKDQLWELLQSEDEA